MSIRLFKLTLLATLCFSLPTEARESKQKRKQNALAVRRVVSTLLRISDTYERSDGNFTLIKPLVEILNRDRKIIAEKLKQPTKDRLSKRIDAVVELAKTPGNKESLKSLSAGTKSYILRLFDIEMGPAQTPDKGLGEQMYKSHCALCHGMNGDPTTALARNQREKPISFRDSVFKKTMSPFRIYNAEITGFGGSHSHIFDDRMSDHELWSIAFYSILFTLDNVETTTKAAEKVKLPTLSQISISSNEEIAKTNNLRLIREKISFQATVAR